jgi:hypothetical protein
VDAHHSVTIRIDQLKELKLAQIMEAFAEGESWLLVRQNDLEGVVERHRLDDMAKLIQDGKNVVVLKVWRANEGSKDKRKGGRNKSRKVGFANPSDTKSVGGTSSRYGSSRYGSSMGSSRSDGASSNGSTKSGQSYRVGASLTTLSDDGE